MKKQPPTYHELLAALVQMTDAAQQHRDWCKTAGERADISAALVNWSRKMIERAKATT